jgi:excisionase family DNA binding protein
MGYYEELYGSHPSFLIRIDEEFQGENPDCFSSENSMSKVTSSKTPQQCTSTIAELPLDTVETALPRFYTVEETAEYLGLKVKRVHEHVRNGKLQCVQLSAKDRKFTEEQIKDFLQRRSTPLPKPLDHKPRERVRCSPERRKSSGGSSFRALRKEIQSW